MVRISRWPIRCSPRHIPRWSHRSCQDHEKQHTKRRIAPCKEGFPAIPASSVATITCRKQAMRSARPCLRQVFLDVSKPSTLTRTSSPGVRNRTPLRIEASFQPISARSLCCLAWEAICGNEAVCFITYEIQKFEAPTKRAAECRRLARAGCSTGRLREVPRGVRV